MKQYQERIGNSVLEYEINDDKTATVTGVSRPGSRLVIPHELSGCPVTAIGKKAFLGQRSIAEVTVPESVCEIGDYAFAQCPSLRRVVLCGEGVRVSRAAFVESRGIEHICYGRDEDTCLSALTAALIVRLHADYLLADEHIGSDDWYGKWDNELRRYLAQDDAEGYTDLVLCGEEDIQFDESEYVMKKRMDKAALCLTRLMNDESLAADMKRICTDYVLAHVKGCEDDAAWRALLCFYPENLPYFKLFAELGDIRDGAKDEMIADMGDVASETKAFIMEYQSGGSADVFDMFRL